MEKKLSLLITLLIWLYIVFAVVSCGKIDTDTGTQTDTKAESNTNTDAVSNTDTETEPVECLHMWDEGNIKTSSTCEINGIKTFICLNCGEERNEELPLALNHQYNDTYKYNEFEHYKEPICSHKDQIMALAEHTMSDWKITKEPTRTVEGSYERKCQTCDYFEIDSISTINYDYTEGLCYTLNNEGTGYIVSGSIHYWGNEAIYVTLENSSVIAPHWIYNGLPVVEISTLYRYEDKYISQNGSEIKIPANKNYIKTIIIPETVKKFDCSSPATLTTIEVAENNPVFSSLNGVLYNKNKTKLIMCPSGKSVSGFAFPSTVTEIGDGAFSSNLSLTRLVIPEGITSIGDGAFSSCINLKSVSLPNSIVHCGSSILGSFLSYENSDDYFALFTIEKNCSYLGNSSNPYLVLIENRYYDEMFAINSRTKVIASNAYYSPGCSASEVLNIPDSVVSIGDNFLVTDPYKTINIGSGLQHLGEFGNFGVNNNAYVENFNVSSQNQYFSSENGVLYNKDKTELIYYPKNKSDLTTFTIPSTCKSIRANAFYENKALKEIIIPESVESIGDYAFYHSKATVNIPQSIQTIGDYAYCNINFETIIFPNTLTHIGEHAFFSVDDLKEITLPSSVLTIGESAFSLCPKLTRVNYLGNIEQWCNIFFDGYGANPLRNGASLYLNGDLVTNLIIPDTVTSIGCYAFEHCTSLTSVTIPDSVTFIGNNAFYYCTSLTSVTIPDSVTFIGSNAFYYCTPLTSIKIPDSVTSIGDYAFKSCTSLTSVTIGSGVTSIRSYAFYGCYKLVEVYNLSSLNITVGSNNNGYVGYYAKVVHTSLDEESILETVGDYIFMTWEDKYYLSTYIGNETEITLPQSYNGNIYDIYQYAFYKNRVNKIIIPDSVTFIGKDAFYYCTSLTSVTIPNSVTFIEKDAFRGCSSLASVTIGNGVTTIGGGAFLGCSSLTSVTIPDGVTSIGYEAFYGCTSLTIYCEGTSRPSGWDSNWNYSNRPVYWYSENEPTEEGNYWHYVDGVVTIWE